MLDLIFPNIFILYAVIFACTGCHVVAVLFTSLLTGALFVYKLPKCSPQKAFAILQPEKVCIIAHRGAGLDGPENTLGAIRQAKKNGADAVEFDVDFTQDGVAVVIHDDTVDRTTDGAGPVKEHTLEKLKTLSASAKHPNKAEFSEEKIPTLEETVELCLELKLRMYIDVKSNAKLAVAALTSLFNKYPDLYSSAIVCSFYPHIVYLVKRADLQIVTGLTHRHRVMTRKVDGTERDGRLYQKILYPLLDRVHEWSIYAWLWYLCGNSAFLVNIGDVSKTMIDYFRKREVQVVVWTVNSDHEKNYLTHSLHCSYMTDTLIQHHAPPQTT